MSIGLCFHETAKLTSTDATKPNSSAITDRYIDVELKERANSAREKKLNK